MARQLKLVRLDDFISDIDSIDLFAGGYSLAEDGYTPMVAPLGATSVHEVITLKIQGSSKDNLATLIQAVDAKIKQVQWWLDDPGIERYQVWLRVQQDNETNARQAQIVNILPPDKIRVFQPEEYNNNYIGEYSIGIERTPYWEAPYTYPTTTGMDNLNIIGGTATLSETINGDVPARLARLTVVTDSSSGRVSDFWAGWKTSRFGASANFIPVWELHNGAEMDVDTTAVADATAYDGTKITTTFSADATLILREKILVSDVTTAHSGVLADQRGSYLVLLRAKMSDTSIARVRLAAGQFSGSKFNSPVYRSRIVISGTGWNLYEMGNIKIPPSRLPVGYTFPNFALGFYAERISGSGSLDMDCAILIPIDDGAVKMECTGGLQGGQIMEVYQAADDSLWSLAGFAVGDGRAIFSVVPKPQGYWSLPANGEKPVIVIAATDNINGTGNLNGKTVDLTYAYIPRWRTLRGNVT